MIGERVGQWVVDVELGANAIGPLFRVHDADDPSKTAALRLFSHRKALSPEFVKNFLAQIDLLKKLKHPCLVCTLDGGLHKNAPFYVMEWISGEDMQSVLRRGEKLPWNETLAIALHIVPALRYAHRRSVLHRDIRPSNIFRCRDGTYKLAGFGITKFFGDSLWGDVENPLGSVAYVSPEQTAGKPHTKRSDFYALGGLLYTLTVGRPPFSGSTVVELIRKHCFVLPERPIHFVPDLPEEIDRFIMRLLSKKPSERPGSGTSLIQELEGIWSLLERRGLVGKRPAQSLADSEVDPLDADPHPPSRVPAPILQAPTPWHRRWYVVGPLFAGCVMLLLWAFYWRVPSANELMSKALPLMVSEDPHDWDRAWADYLEPLSRKYPDKYRDEVKEFKRRMEDQGEMRHAFINAKTVRHRNEANRFYVEGVRLVQAGEFASARLVWQNLIALYSSSEDAKHWVALAREGLQRIDDRDSVGPRLEELTRPNINEIKRLRAAGKLKEADALAKALEFLYRDDPEIELLKQMLATSKD